MGLLGAEGAAGHAEDQPISCLLTPEGRAIGTGMTTADWTWVEAVGAVATGAALAAGVDALLAVLSDPQGMQPPAVRRWAECFRAETIRPEVMPVAAGVLAQEDHLPAAKEEHLKRFAFAGIGAGCSNGLALEFRGAISLERQLGDLFERGPAEHLEAEGIVIAMHLPGGDGPGVEAEIEGGGAVEIEGKQRPG